jgi:hypothetical protein
MIVFPKPNVDVVLYTSIPHPTNEHVAVPPLNTIFKDVLPAVELVVSDSTCIILR